MKIRKDCFINPLRECFCELSPLTPYQMYIFPDLYFSIFQINIVSFSKSKSFHFPNVYCSIFQIYIFPLTFHVKLYFFFCTSLNAISFWNRKSWFSTNSFLYFLWTAMASLEGECSDSPLPSPQHSFSSFSVNCQLLGKESEVVSCCLLQTLEFRVFHLLDCFLPKAKELSLLCYLTWEETGWIDSFSKVISTKVNATVYARIWTLLIDCIFCANKYYTINTPLLYFKRIPNEFNENIYPL